MEGKDEVGAPEVKLVEEEGSITRKEFDMVVEPGSDSTGLRDCQDNPGMEDWQGITIMDPDSGLVYWPGSKEPREWDRPQFQDVKVQDCVIGGEEGCQAQDKNDNQASGFWRRLRS